MIMAKITKKLTAINNQYEIYELMRHCPHNENVCLKISPCETIAISTKHLRTYPELWCKKMSKYQIFQTRYNSCKPCV